MLVLTHLKFMYSEKATKFREISALLLSNVVPVKSKAEILQNFVAFSEYMNFHGQNYAGDFTKFCGLLRIHELYDCHILIHFHSPCNRLAHAVSNS